MLSLNVVTVQLTEASSVHCYGHVLRRALNFEVEGQSKKERLRVDGRSRLRKKV